MEKNINGWSIHKMFSEIKFAPSPNFFDKKTEFLTKFMKEYPQYNASVIDALQMHTLEHPGADLSISPNRYVLNVDYETDKYDFLELAKRSWPFISNKLNINYIDRLGVRAIFIKEVNEIEANKFILKYLNLDKVNSNADLIQSELILVYRELNSKIRINIKQGSIQSLLIGSNNNAKSLIKKGLIVDIDYSIEQFKSNDANKYFDTSIDRIKFYLTSLL